MEHQSYYLKPKPPEENLLQSGVLGVGAITFFVISAAGPLVAIAGGIPVAMLLGNGPGTPAALCLVVAVLLAFAAGYTTMARHVTNTGGFYAFAAQGLGGVVGGAASMVALVCYNCMQIGIYGMLGAAASGLCKECFGWDLSWWAYAYVAMALIGYMGYRKVDLSMKVLSWLVVAEYLGILILDIVILHAKRDNGINLTSFTPSAFLGGSAPIALLFAFTAFIGFEATTIYSEEAKDPEKTIPKATYISVILIGAFYAFSTWCMVLAAGSDKLVDTLKGLQDPTTFLFSLSDQFAGSGLTLVLRILFVTSVFAGLLAFHNATARYFYAMGRDGILHAKLGTTHTQYQSPHTGSLLQSALAVIIVAIFAAIGCDPVMTLFSWLTNVCTLGVLLLMVLTSLAVIAFFHNRPELNEGPWHTKILPVISGIAIAAVFVLAVVNFDVLTGASRHLSIGLTSIVPIAAIIGALRASLLRRSEPEKFAELGFSKL